MHPGALALRRSLPRAIGLGRAVGVGDLPSLPPNVTTGQYSAALQATLKAQTTQVQAQIQSATGVNTTSSQVSQGASSAASLIANGYDPSNDADNANLVHAIAGGVCLIPGVGPILGAAVEGLWLVGNQIAGPLQNALASIGLGTPANQPPCQTKGKWTTANILAGNAGELPPMPTGSFAAFVIPALAYGAAMVGDCQKIPPAAAIVDACVLMWNQVHAGPAVPYYVPSMYVQPGSASPAPALLLRGSMETVSGTTPSAKAGQVGNVYYAFQPTSVGQPYAFVDLSNPPTDARPFWLPYGVQPFNVDSDAIPVGMTATDPRIVMVNSGALIAPHTITVHLRGLTLTPPASAVTPAQGAALGALGTVAVVAAGGSLYAFLTNQAVGYFWGKVFDSVVDGIKGVLSK